MAAKMDDEVEKKKTDKQNSQEIVFRDDLQVLYINVVVLDPSKAVEQTVTRTLQGNDRIPQPLKKAATKLAARLATPELVAQQMVTILPQKMPEKMKQKGLTVVCDTVFHEGPYLVVQLQVQSVSPEILVEAQSMDHYDEDTGELEDKRMLDSGLAATIIGWIQAFLFLLGLRNKKHIETDFLPRLLNQRLEPIMNQVLGDKLETKGIQAATKVCLETTQARFFYSLLKHVRASDDLSMLQTDIISIGPALDVSEDATSTSVIVEETQKVATIEETTTAATASRRILPKLFQRSNKKAKEV